MNKKVLYEQIMRKISAEVRNSLNEMSMINSNIFNEFDEFDIFSDKYYIVSKNNKFNLADRNGKLISNKWFESIEKTNNGIELKITDGIPVSVKTSDVDTTTINSVIRLSGISLPKNINISSIEYVKPYTFNKLIIIANVIYKGRTLLIDENGKLYNGDGTIFRDDFEERKDSRFDISNLKKYRVTLYYELCPIITFPLDFKNKSRDELFELAEDKFEQTISKTKYSEDIYGHSAGDNVSENKIYQNSENIEVYLYYEYSPMYTVHASSVEDAIEIAEKRVDFKNCPYSLYSADKGGICKEHVAEEIK